MEFTSDHSGNKRRKKVYADLQIAKLIGLNSAVILERIVWSLSKKTEKDRKEYYFDGRWWMSSTIEDFINHTSLKKGAVLRAIKKLSLKELIEIKRRISQAGQKPNFYTVNWENFLLLCPDYPESQNETLPFPEMIPRPSGRSFAESHNDTLPSTDLEPGRVSKRHLLECQNDTLPSTDLEPGRVSNRDTLSKSLLRVFLESLPESTKSLAKREDARAREDLFFESSSDFSLSETPKQIQDETFEPHSSEDRKNTPPVEEKSVPATLVSNEKRITKKAVKKPRAKIIEYSSNDLRLGTRWYEESVQRVTSPHKIWSPENFAEHIAKAKRRTNVSDEVMEKVVNFCLTDYFWSKNCRSPSSLLKRNAQGELRIDTLMNQLITKTDMEFRAIRNLDKLTPEEERALNPFL